MIHWAGLTRNKLGMYYLNFLSCLYKIQHDLRSEGWMSSNKNHSSELNANKYNYFESTTYCLFLSCARATFNLYFCSVLIYNKVVTKSSVRKLKCCHSFSNLTQKCVEGKKLKNKFRNSSRKCKTKVGIVGWKCVTALFCLTIDF